jgi:hypothetical protein
MSIDDILRAVDIDSTVYSEICGENRHKRIDRY